MSIRLSPDEFDAAVQLAAADHTKNDDAALVFFSDADMALDQAVLLVAAGHANAIRRMLQMLATDAVRTEALACLRQLIDPAVPHESGTINPPERLDA